MILIIDNYDSFTYNLFQYVSEFTTDDVNIIRNDKIAIDEIKTLSPSHIILSPGPKYPIDAGICIELIKAFYKSIPIFGICLGHQAIYEAFGGSVIKTPNVMHGKASTISIIKSSLLYETISKKFTATRYHSLICDEKLIPVELEVTSETDEIIMGIKHKTYHVYGCQYHPESILTEFGKEHFRNFLSINKKGRNKSA